MNAEKGVLTMDNVNITLNGDIIINFDVDDFAGNEDFTEALASAICKAVLCEDEDFGDDCEDACSVVNTAIALIYPDGIKNVDSYDEYSPIIDDMDESCEFSVKGEPFNLVFERKGLITVDGASYLAVPAFVLFHDSAMQPVSADAELLKELEDFLDCNRAAISFGRCDVEVIELEGGICAGV